VRDNVVHYEALYRIMDILDAIAEEANHSVADVALAWLLTRPTVTSLLLGARTEQHLMANLSAADLQLTPEQIARLDAASSQPKAYPYWHQSLKPEFHSQIFY